MRLCLGVPTVLSALYTKFREKETKAYLPRINSSRPASMAGDGLAQHISSEVDFYEILGVKFETSESDIRRAYRRTALRYHPDKQAGNVEKFHLLQSANDVLTDAAAKAAYDEARAARLAKQRQKELLHSWRRQMVDDLERREQTGLKRGRDDGGFDDAEEKLRREVARLAEDGKRRRKEREEMLRREKLEEDEEEERNRSAAERMMYIPDKDGVRFGDGVSEIDRSVRVRWARDEPGGDFIDKETLATRFSRFGAIDSTFLLKDKRQRIEANGKEEKKKKKTTTTMATGVIQFASIVGAHAAVQDFSKQQDPDLAVFTSVFWASNKEPEFAYPQLSTSFPSSSSSSSPSSAFDTPAASSSSSLRVPFPSATTPHDSSSTPLQRPNDGNPNGKSQSGNNPPTFSFSPKNSPRFGSGPPSQQEEGEEKKKKKKSHVLLRPSLEEVTLIRLKNAEERRRLEDELRQREEEEERLEAAGRG